MSIDFKYLVIALVALSSCAKNGDSIQSSASDDLVPFEIAVSGTKADEAATYCFALMQQNMVEPSYYGYYTSTYITNSNGKSWLTPTLLSTDAADNGCGLAAPAGSYQMLITSPAITPTHSDSYIADVNDGAIFRTVYGLEFEREVASDDDIVYIGDALDVNVNGVSTSATTSVSYIYSLGDSYTLREPRMKIRVSIKAGVLEADAGTGATSKLSYDVNTIYFANVTTKALLNGSEGMFVVEEDDVYPFTTYPEGEAQQVTVENTTAAVLATADTDNFTTFLSADYTDTDKYKVPPTLWITLNKLTTSTDKTRDIPILLNYNFLPQHTYDFVITLTSVAVELAVQSVDSWSNEAGDDDTILDNLPTFTFDISDDKDWTDVDIDENIGSNNNDNK